MEEKRTVEDILREAVQVLDSITLPVALVQSVGVPVAIVSGNLKACLQAYDAEKKKAEGESK